MANIHGLGSVSDRAKQKKDHEMFTSGGKTSSTGVYRPTDRGMPHDIVDQARNQASQTGATPAGDPVATITLYANGFTLNDEPFRDAKEPENKKFLEDLRGGFVPKPLEAEVRKLYPPSVTQVGVNLVNKTSEHFQPPPPKFSFANSQGQSLGGGGRAKPTAADFSSATPQPVQVDESQPTITVQLVLHNRKRLRQKFNQNHTVLDVYRHMMSAANFSAPFVMMAGFPPKALSVPSQTVIEAKLNGASVTMRI